MIGSPTSRDLKLRISPKSKGKLIQHISELKVNTDIESTQLTDRKSPLNFNVSPITPKRSEINSPPISPMSLESRLDFTLPVKLETLLSQTKLDLEEIYYTSEGLWAFKKRVSEAIDGLRSALCDILAHRVSNSRQVTENFKTSSPEVKGIIKDLNRSKGVIASLNKDLQKKMPIIGEYEKKVKELMKSLESERSKNSELSYRMAKMEIERDNLMNTNNSILSSWRNNSKDIKEILEITDQSISSPKNSVSKTLSPRSPRPDPLETSTITTTLQKENEELKKNLDLIIHNYDNLWSKLRIQKEEFQKYKNQTDEFKFFSEVKMRDLIFDLYLKICPEEENRLKINTQFSNNPESFFSEMIENFSKLKETNEIHKFLLQKSQEETQNILSKIANDQEFFQSRENDLRAHYINELNLTKSQILRQKEKRRGLKTKLNETLKIYNQKLVESQILSEELTLTQSKGVMVIDEIKDKNREIEVIEQECRVKAEQIVALKKDLKDKEEELKVLKEEKNKGQKTENEFEKEVSSLKDANGNLQNQVKAMKKLIEDTESRENHLEFQLKIKEAELKGLESKLALQLSINDRLKDTYASTKADILKKYKEKLEDKEKLFQDLQEQNENLSKKLENSSKLLQSSQDFSKQSENSQLLSQEFADSKLLLVSLISKLSAKTGESVSEPGAGLKDSIRIIDSLTILLVNQLDSATSQAKLAQAEQSKLQEDLHRNQLTIHELLLKNSGKDSGLSSEHIKYLLKDKCNTRKALIASLETQLKEKELIHLQTVQLLTEKYNSKKERVLDRLRDKERELIELRKRIEEGIKTENMAAMQEHEMNLKAMLDEANSKLAKAAEEVIELKGLKEADEKAIQKLNKKILKLEQRIKELEKSEMSLKEERAALRSEYDEKIRGLQESIAEMTTKREENDSDSLEQDDEIDLDVKIQTLFKQLQEKEMTVKKANKRIMELQWAHRDVIEQCKENEEKVQTQTDANEKLTEENDKLTEKISELNSKLTDQFAKIEEYKDQLRIFRETEAGFKFIEANLQDSIDELKIKNENLEDEISALQLELTEFQNLLKTYADENTALSITNRTLSETIKKLKEDCEDYSRDKQILTSNLSKLKQELSSRESCFELERVNHEKMKEILEQEKFNLEQQIFTLQGQHENDDEKIHKLFEDMQVIGESKRLLRKSTSESLDKVDIIEKLQHELESKAEEIEEYQIANSDLQKQINELMNDLSIKDLTINEKVLKASQEVLTLKNDLKSVKTEKKNLEKSAEDLSKALEKVKSDVYDKENEIKKLIEEKQVMVNYAKSKLQGQDLEELLKIKDSFAVLEDLNRQLVVQIENNKQRYEEIIESLEKELEVFRKTGRSSSKSMWNHVDHLTKQLTEKSRQYFLFRLMEKEVQSPNKPT